MPNHSVIKGMSIMRIRNMEMLTRHGNIKGRTVIAELLNTGLKAIDPYLRVKELVKIENNRIILDNRGYEMKDDPHSGPAIYDLKDYDRVYVVGAGKGIQQAALAMEEVLGDVLTGGHVIVKHGEGIICKKIGVTLAGHPIPDANCVDGCKILERLAKNITKRDLVFTITGSDCGSLMTYPAGDISIKDVSDFTYLMQIKKGVPTSDLNVVRTHIDRLKGGRLSRLFRPATQIHLVTADPSKMDTPVLRMTYSELLCINNFFPPLPACSTYAEAIEIIKKWDAWEQTPESIKIHLIHGGPHNENMGIEEYESLGARFFGLIFKDATVYPAVRKKAAELGYPCIMLSEYMQAEAREVGYVDSYMALCAERMGEPFKPPVILMSSGETVVTVGEKRGIGGPNQEYCTAAAINISGSRRIVFGAVDTDGTDGPGGLKLPCAPECLAGAIVDGYTMSEAKEAGINLWHALKTHGTSEPLWKLGCGVQAVKNVSALDLRLILIM
jgi:glycerate 2-kinase